MIKKSLVVKDSIFDFMVKVIENIKDNTYQYSLLKSNFLSSGKKFLKLPHVI